MLKYTDEFIKKQAETYLAQNPSTVNPDIYYDDSTSKKQADAYLTQNPSTVDTGEFYTDDKAKKIFQQLTGGGAAPQK